MDVARWTWRPPRRLPPHLLAPPLGVAPPSGLAPGVRAPLMPTEAIVACRVMRLTPVTPSPIRWLTVKSKDGRWLIPPEAKKRTPEPGGRSLRFSDHGLRVETSTMPRPRSSDADTGWGAPGRVTLTP